MLITFSTKAWADITMFGEVAVNLLKLMGHSGTVPGALLAEDIPEALEKLKAGIEAENTKPSEPPPDDDPDEPKVDLSLRAYPLIELLTAAAKENQNVMWDS